MAAKKRAAKKRMAKRGAAASGSFDATDKATRPAWLTPGAWTFTYERGASRAVTTRAEVTDVGDVAAWTRDELAAFKRDGALQWRGLALEKQHVDVIRLMVGAWEEAFSACVARGDGATLYVLSDGANAPLVLVDERAGSYARLVEINPR